MRILATSGGFHSDRPSQWQPGPLIDHLLEMTGRKTGARLCYLGTAGGDNATSIAAFYSALASRTVKPSHLSLFTMPNVDDVRAHLLAQDAIWVGGGSVANLLAVWRVHGIDEIMREAWESGVVLAGVSAGSICWHIGGTTDSFGFELQPVTNGLGLLPFGNGVHYDSEPNRRALLHSLVGDGTLPLSFATDDGVGLVYEGTDLVEAVADRPDVYAYRVGRTDDDSVVETVIEPRLL